MFWISATTFPLGSETLINCSFASFLRLYCRIFNFSPPYKLAFAKERIVKIVNTNSQIVGARQPRYIGEFNKITNAVPLPQTWSVLSFPKDS
jgi:hypothetical protein